MHKTYITFGQDHIHRINNKIFDKDSVAVINSKDAVEGRNIAFELFGPKFCMEYSEDQWSDDKMIFFPRGYINAN